MHKWIVGLNSSGKTVNLYKELNQNRTPNTVTNLQKVCYNNFDETRLDLICNSYEWQGDMFEYDEIEIINNSIVLKMDGMNYTQAFLDIITLLCRKGDTLILDEPEYGLYESEIPMLMHCLMYLIPTYKNVTIATHCQYLFAVEPDNFYWCENYKLKKITQRELYEHIGQL